MTNPNVSYEISLTKGRFVVFNQRPAIDFLQVKQIHSNTVVPEDHCQGNDQPKADGIVGKSVVPKAILTADCLPLVLWGKDEHAVIHAGWRGLAQNILAQEEVRRIHPLHAFIGPHIRVNQYVVQADFKDNFPGHPEAFTHRDGKVYLDLAQIATAQLKHSYPGIVIQDSLLCTYLDPKFHSYRRNQTTERNWNIYFPK